MPVAIDSPSYLGERLSDNIAKTPEGYLICRNAVIGRSGFQTYLVKEIQDPEGLLSSMGADQEVQIWRDPQQVFSPQTLASFEGKTFTLTHPQELLDPDSDTEHHAGHVQNVRKGKDPLDSGDLPMLADILVKDRDAIDAIERGERELSCGYSYDLGRTGDRFEQRNIIGNHVALVQRARAGSDARINDAAPTKERPKVKNLMSHIFGTGLKAYLADAKPEEVAEVLEQINTDGVRAQYDRGKNGAGEGARLVLIGTDQQGHKLYRQLGRDEEEGKEEKREEKTGDAEMTDRKRLHDALDRMLDAKTAQDTEKAAQEDADLKELGNLFKEHMGEEAKEPEHQGDDGELETLEEGKDAEGKEEEERKEEEGKDGKKEGQEEGEDSEVVRPEPDLDKSDLPESQFDSAFEVLKAMRPIIARSTDPKVRKAFDTAVKSVKAARRAEKEGNGSYAAFHGAARSHGKDSAKEGESPIQKRVREFDDVYAQAAKARAGHGNKK